MSNQLYNDQDLLLIVNSGASPNVRNDQDLLIIVQQRLIPQTIRLDDDQELVIIVERRAPHGILTATPATTIGNGVATVTITATVLSLNGAPLSNVSVTFSQSGNAVLSASSGVTDVNGQVVITATDEFTELVTFSATGVPFTSVDVQFTASRVDGNVYNTNGIVIPGAQLYIADPLSTVTNPPSLLLNVYSDPDGQQLITQPLITDGLGAYRFYSDNEIYTLVVVNNGAVVQAYLSQEAGKPTAVAHNVEWWVKSSSGPALPGALVYVVDNSAANIPTTLKNGVPNPQVNLYSNVEGSNLITQPLTTDSFGYAHAYANAGMATVLVYLNGALQATYPDQTIGPITTTPLARRDGWFRNSQGQAQANFRVFVCNQPCSPPGTLVPQFPDNLADIYSDSFGFSAIAQTLTYNPVNNRPIISSLQTDANGHYAFYAPANTLLTIAIYNQNGVLQVLYPDQVL